jgi:general secretion pathway protein A
MSTTYRAFFGLQKEPFPMDLAIKDILHTPQVSGVLERVDYTIELGAITLVTGDIGSGKSTALRCAASKLHPSQYRVVSLTASSGSILEFYRLFLNELGIDMSSNSKALMVRTIKREILDLTLARKIKPVLIVDEASLIRLEVFAELHTLTQFEQDSKPYLPVILAGQSSLIDRLIYRTSLPLASRIITRSHLEGVNRQEMEDYLIHHLNIAGLKHNCFDDAAMTAIHQGSGGLFRKANHLARGAMLAAANQKTSIVNAEHVRMAASELF